MPFDLSTAQPVGGFDLSTAKPIEQPSAKDGVPGRIVQFLNKYPGGPLGISMGLSNELLDKAAYKAGGAVTDVASKVLPPEAAAAAGYATNVGMQALPVVAGGLAGKLAQPAVEAMAKDVMQSALKPTLKALTTGKAAQAIDTMLENGVNATSGGLAKLRGMIARLNGQIADAIGNSPATVDKGKVASALQGTLAKFERQVNPQSDLKAIQSAWDDFLNHPMLVGTQDIPVKTAQALKTGTYKALGDKSYGELKGASIEAQKSLARGLKDEIATAVPGIAGLNQQESQLLNALNIAERRVLMDANKNPGGLSWLAHSPSMWAAFIADRSPLFKSLAARMIHSGSGTIPVTAGAATGATAGLYEGSR